MVKKIKVINLIEDEIKTEAEELNSIVEEMAIVEPIVEPIVESIIEPMEPVIMKKKKTTKAKTEIVKVIPEKIIINFDNNKII